MRRTPIREASAALRTLNALKRLRRTWLPAPLSVAILISFLAIALLAGVDSAFHQSSLTLTLSVVAGTSIVAFLMAWNTAVQGTARDSRLRLIGDERFVNAIGDIFRTSISDDDATHRSATRLGNYLGVSRCFFSETGPNNSEVVANDFHEGLKSLAGTLATSWLCQTEDGKPLAANTIVVQDASTDARSLAKYETTYHPAGIRAFVAVHLSKDDQQAAMMFVGSPHSRIWQEKEISLVRAVAEKLWGEFEHERLINARQAIQIRDAVKESEKRLNLVVEAIGDQAIFLIDETGYVLTWNSGAERLTGYKTSEIVGQHFSIFYAKDSVALGHPAEKLAQAVAAGKFEEDGWRVRKDGSRFWANVVITTMRGLDGGVQGFIKITRDFTERRLADQVILQSQADLRAALKEREVLLQEIQHRVKNNLQVISSLMNLQVRHVANAPAREALVDCLARIDSIALIHEKLDQSTDSANVPFSEYTEGLAINVFQALGVSPDNVHLQLDLGTVLLAVDRAVSCGLILNELITNALKHAFPAGRSGVVRIELRQVAGEVRLTIGDDGVGMPDEIDLAKTKTLGMQLVATLVEQLDGEIRIARGGGTAVHVTFPLEAK